MSWFVLALIAMLCWSGSDLFGKIGSRPDDKLSHWKMVVAVGLVMGVHAAVEIFVQHTPINLKIIVAYLPASILYILSMTLGYVGLRYIELSISSPICNCSGAVSAVALLILSVRRLHTVPEFELFGESYGGFTVFSIELLSPLSILAIALMACGVVMLGIVESREDEALRLERQKAANVRYAKSALALLLPILYCILDAAGTTADALILETLDKASANVAYELTFLAMGAVAAVYVFGVRREKVLPSRETPKLLGAVCETAGQLAYVYALSANAVGAAPIISCYCLVSVLLSRIFLKEKLSFKHYLAIAIAAVGIVISGALDP